MPKLMKKTIHLRRTDGQTNPDYRKASLLKIPITKIAAIPSNMFYGEFDKCAFQNLWLMEGLLKCMMLSYFISVLKCDKK